MTNYSLNGLFPKYLNLKIFFFCHNNLLLCYAELALNMLLMVRNNKISKKKSGKKRNIAIAIVSIIVFILIILIGKNFIHKKSPRSSRRINHLQGKAVDYCRKSPQFPLKYGLKPPFAIDLRQNMENKGLKILEIRKGGKAMKLPEWENFGYLGLYTLDDLGNIYTSPFPYVSIDINPPKEQNKVLIVNNSDGKMEEFIRLKSKNPPTPKNPFGVVGLAFDCDTKSLYATSISGSTYKDESGIVYQINTRNRKIMSKYEGLDVLGVGIFQAKYGKRLYMGVARKPEIYSVGLNDDGSFSDDIRFEFSLVDAQGGGLDNAHRIIFKGNQMMLKARPFNYTLMVASNTLRTIYIYNYDVNSDKWNFVEAREE